MHKQEGLSAELKYRLLLDISEKVRGTLELERVLDHLIEAVGTVIRYDAAGIFVLNRTLHPSSTSNFTPLIAAVSMRGFPPRPPDADPMLRSGKGIVGHVIRTGETVVAPDVRREPRYIEGRPGTLSEIAVPIIIGSRVIGALNLESDRTYAFSDADVELLQSISNAAAISIEKAMLHRQLMENRRREIQMTTAREVQVGLLPAEPPRLPGYEIAGMNLPNFDISGDYFDFIPLRNGELGIVVADVSGKGVPAALIMATFRAALRTQIRHDPDPTRALPAVHNLLQESLHVNAYVTTVYGVLSPLAGLFTYTNCGHNPPLLLRRSGNTEKLECGGMPLGIPWEPAFASACVKMEPGDIMAFYTDGVSELALSEREDLGADGLDWILRSERDQSAQGLINGVVRATQVLTRGGGYPDDFTLVIIRRLENCRRPQ